MRSIRTKLLAFIIGSVVIAACVILIVSIVNTTGIQREASEEIIRKIGSENKVKIDEILDNTRDAVENIYYYAQDQMGSSSHILLNYDMLNEHIEDVREVALSAAEHTDGCITVYYRLDPSLSLSNYGFWYGRDKDGKTFHEEKLTDIKQYDKNDTEHVGWFYKPIEEGHAVWLDPYFNKNYGTEMISYVIPVYSGDHAIGVVGMDVDTFMLREAVSDISVFENGYAVLMDTAGNIVYHPEFVQGLKSDEFPTRFIFAKDDIDMMERTGKIQSYKWNDDTKSLYIESLENGMRLVITAFDKDIYADGFKGFVNTILAFLLILAVTPFITFWFVNTVIAPLKDVNRSAEEFFGGNLEDRVDNEANDETGLISRNYNKMADMIKRYFEYFHGLSFNDELTGLNNKSAFSERIKMVNSEMELGRSRFAVIVMDLNDLKTINDNFGHERGDLLIKGVAGIMKDIFGQDSVYRTGGDDFVAILTSHVTGDVQKIIQRFRKMVDEYAAENIEIFGVKVSVAIGYSTYIKTMDSSFSDVFDRADDSMREDKQLSRGTHII